MPATETNGTPGNEGRSDMLHTLMSYPSRDEVESLLEDRLTAKLTEYHHYVEKVEDTRANHRNKNRVLMLLVAAIWSFMLPVLVVTILGAAVLASIGSFLLFITLVPDLFLSLYSYFKRY